MKRRTFIQAAGVGCLGVLAGCSGETTDPTPDPDPPTQTTSAPPESTIRVAAMDVDAPDPDVALDITYAVATARELPTDPPTLAEDGMQWVLVRMDVTTANETTRNLEANPYVLEAAGDRFEYVSSDAAWELSSKTASGDEPVTGWVIFQVPEPVDTATLTIRDNTRDAYTVSFEQDRSLNTTPPA
jgi:hypothetical protein